jgi:catechol-2,3-dioxygenase
MKILRLELWTQDLDGQVSFYADKLRLPVLEHTPETVTFRAGQSELIFRKADPKWRGFYHIAFNILESKFDEIHLWLAENVLLIPNRDWQDIFYFKNWDARGMYSKDPAGNIVEFVARHDLSPEEGDESGAAHILAVGEIGTVVENVPAFVSELASKLGTHPYHETLTESFAAVGDNDGLLLVARKGREWYPNNGQLAQFAPMKIKLQVDKHEYLLEAKRRLGLFEQRDIEKLS